MYKRKNRFLTFLFSLLPGAGHMYLGLMKNGVSFMGVFFFFVFLASWLEIGALIYVIPVVWFYSFFDCLNKSGMSDEELVNYKDDYLFSVDSLLKMDKSIIKKRSLVIGMLLLLFGCYLLFQNVIDVLRPFFPISILGPMREIINYLPKVLVSIGIIALGVHLISSKKKESENND